MGNALAVAPSGSSDAKQAQIKRSHVVSALIVLMKRATFYSSELDLRLLL